MKNGSVTDAPAARHSTWTPVPEPVAPPTRPLVAVAADTEPAPPDPPPLEPDVVWVAVVVVVVTAALDEVARVGRVAAPVPTWPLPRVPGVALDCAATGAASARKIAAARDRTRFMPGQRRQPAPVPALCR